MLTELQKVSRLTDARYLTERILTPALNHARERELVTSLEQKVLLSVAHKGIAKLGDLKEVMPDMNDAQRTYQIRKLVERRMLAPTHEGARQYTVSFSNNYLLRGVIKALSAEGFIPDALTRAS